MPATRTILALGAVAIVSALQAGAGPRLAVWPFHAAAVAFAAWHAGTRAGLLVAGAAALAGIALDASRQPPDLLTGWNGLASAAGFAAVARIVGSVRTTRRNAANLEGRVAELVRVEHSLARTDPLTSLCNRRAFIDALQQAGARSRRSGGALAVARLDVDNFSALNDTYSRADGDQLLRTIATSLSLTTRMGDLAARLENDEFAVLLYGCGPEDARRVGERLVSEVADLGRAYPEARITASVGIACFASPGPDPDEMMRLAGAALARARRDGGNAVLVQRERGPRDVAPA